jgi:hypothetical protein
MKRTLLRRNIVKGRRGVASATSPTAANVFRRAHGSHEVVSARIVARQRVACDRVTQRNNAIRTLKLADG